MLCGRSEALSAAVCVCAGHKGSQRWRGCIGSRACCRATRPLQDRLPACGRYFTPV
jgi:hypothetical protein